jgi:hypothetical protein
LRWLGGFIWQVLETLIDLIPEPDVKGAVDHPTAFFYTIKQFLISWAKKGLWNLLKDMWNGMRDSITHFFTDAHNLSIFEQGKRTGQLLAKVLSLLKMLIPVVGEVGVVGTFLQEGGSISEVIALAARGKFKEASDKIHGRSAAPPPWPEPPRAPHGSGTLPSHGLQSNMVEPHPVAVHQALAAGQHTEAIFQENEKQLQKGAHASTGPALTQTEERTKSPGRRGGPKHVVDVNDTLDRNPRESLNQNFNTGGRILDAVGELGQPVEMRKGIIIYPQDENCLIIVESERCRKSNNGKYPVSEGRRQLTDITRTAPTAAIVVTDYNDSEAQPIIYPPKTQPPPGGRLKKDSPVSVPFP